MAIDPRPCAECGAQINPTDAFALNINSATHDELEAIFCRPDHAAHWLTKPIPQAMPEGPFTAGDGLILLSALVLLALAVIGVIALFSGVDVNPF